LNFSDNNLSEIKEKQFFFIEKEINVQNDKY